MSKPVFMANNLHSPTYLHKYIYKPTQKPTNLYNSTLTNPPVRKILSILERGPEILESVLFN